MTRETRFRTAGLIRGCLGVTLSLYSCGGGYSSPPTPNPVAQPAPTPTPTPTPNPTPTPTPGATTVVIEIFGERGNMSFAPETADLRIGQQVRWHNADTTVHTATADRGGFDTGFLLPGATSAPIAVSTPGLLRYHCSVHSSMVGTLNVTQ